METKDDDHEPSSSDVGSREKKRIDDSVSQEDENAAKETPVSSSSSSSLSEARTTNQDLFKETKGEEAEASDEVVTVEEVKKKRKLNDESSIFSDILADIEANPKILVVKNKKEMNITCRWFEDSTPLDLNPAVLRQLEDKSKLIDILELESLKGRKQEAIEEDTCFDQTYDFTSLKRINQRGSSSLRAA